MILDVAIIIGLTVLIVADYIYYKRTRELSIAHNSLLLYHHYFLQTKYDDYGVKPKD